MARYGPKPKPPEERFWKHVTPGGADECWEWQGATQGGYGNLLVTHKPKQRTVKAHRLSWEIHNGPIPEGKNVLHRCDNPPCVNPAHLYVGTPADNARDRAERKRGREHRPENRGAKAPRAKLTRAQAEAIMEALSEVPRRSQASIGAEFGVTQQTVSRIMHGVTWYLREGE